MPIMDGFEVLIIFSPFQFARRFREVAQGSPETKLYACSAITQEEFNDEAESTLFDAFCKFAGSSF
jgi:hypothetical protein